MNTISAFFVFFAQNQGTFFQFLKQWQGIPPHLSPLVAPLLYKVWVFKLSAQINEKVMQRV